MKALLLLFLLPYAVLPLAYAVALMPLLWLIQRTFIEPGEALFSAGPVDVTAVDFAILILLGKFLFEILCKRDLVADRRLYGACAIFLAVNFLATLAAGVKFGEAHLLGCATSLARLGSYLLLVPIAAQALKTVPQARRCLWILLGTLGVVAAIQFVNFFGAGHGFIIGEVQGMERGEVRYFGPVGDAVGFVLLLGYLLALCFGRLASAAAFLGAIFLTAGLGAIFATALGTGFFLLAAGRAPAFGAAVRRCAWLLPVLLLVGLVLGLVFARPLFGPLLDRVGTGGYASSGSQRLDSARMAGAMILDNPLLGVGYMGYQRSLERYGGEKVFDLTKSDGAMANANNQILQSLADSGVPGLAAFVWLILCAARCFLGLAARRDEPFFSAVFLGSFLWLLALFFGDLAAVWLLPSFGGLLLFILLGVAAALPRLLAEHAEKSPESHAPAATELALA